MAHSNQARKRARQSDKARQRNKSQMSTLKSAMKTLLATIQGGDKAKAGSLLAKTCKIIDKAAEQNVIHLHKASRHKSQVMRAVAAMK